MQLTWNAMCRIGVLAAAMLSATLVSAATFTVTGSGEVTGFSDLGVPGEQVTYTFTYDDADFANGTPFGSGGRDYGALVSIPVTAFGSVSGPLPVNDIDSVTAFNSAGSGIDQWSFNSGVNGAIQVNDPTDSTFTSTPPALFADANEIFLDQLTTNLSLQFSDVASFGADAAVTPGAELLLMDNTATVSTAVPEPASIAIWSLLGLALASIGYYRIRRTK